MMKRCMILGNGPSLAEIPETLLNDYVTFGCNRVYLKHVPDIYVYVDPLAHAQGWLHEIEEFTAAKFIVDSQAFKFAGSVPLHCIHKSGFSLQPMEGVYAYFSATTVMLQLAVWMGFNEIGLLGFDHRYNLPNGTRSTYIADGHDLNHFSQNYYPSGAEYNAPRLDLLSNWHEYAKEIMDARGVKVVNFTPASDLTVYQMEYWYRWLN